MTDFTDRPLMPRRAVAEAEVAVSQETLSAIVDGATPKGDVLSVAELAGVMAGKRASDLIPLSHPVGLTDLIVRATPERGTSVVRIRAEAATMAAGGVEMEALTAAAVAALTVYDMVKGLEPGVAVRSVRLISSSGGEAGEWQRVDDPRQEERAPRVARTAGRVAPGPGTYPGMKRRTP